MSGFKVLIVDDSPFMRKVFSDVIDADAAFKVLATAANGQEAVELALKLKPDIITMDLEMPQLNGIEALQKIMSLQPTPVIMLSAVTDNGTRDTIKALQYGAIDFIRKPDGAVKLDIHQVGGQLLEKLHIARESMSKGAFRMLPAVEEKVEIPPQTAPPLTKADLTVAEEAKLAERPPDNKPPKISVEARKPLTESRIPKAPVIRPELKSMTQKKIPLDEVPSINADKASNAKPADPLAPVRSKQRQELKPSAVTEIREVVAKRQSKATASTSKLVQAKPIESLPSKTSTTFTNIVAIGTSTGGPRALHEVLTGIPADFPAPILIVQHMPPKFTHSLAQRLDNFCNIHVREAVDGEPVETATAYIAPGGKHMSLAKDAANKYRIRLSEEGPRSGHMPSVDVLFESLIGHQQLKRHVVIMTGMGSDGAKGMKALQQDGAVTTIAEAEQTCVVYGMPRSAVELGAVSHLLPLQSIASAIVQEVKARKS
ncbi:protein-glutamate methylesterase/protein-glutamine glutaminase [Cohnella abietis]|uniref:Protein-glutamate methylesterase/protein-glutamine glutaminase n=1 Tax=Cohnella abietis TaxID=2507935 RepID=A0A3T1D8L5_9BACL|nr:chemotaxis response regulator protein-glutamate methylesterase [Cohnella abietis]BBI34419.1 chemotaxis response regulator protein-glutamate methylesterase [Cohnella abietis]